MPETIKTKCRVCGKAVDVPVVRVLASDDERHLKELFNGKLNCAACPECGSRIAAPCSLVFKDSEDPYILYELSQPEDMQIDELEQKIDEMATEVFAAEGLPRPVVRIVFSRTDFIEKIAIRRMGIDDRLLEFAKLQLFRTMEEPQLLQCRHRLLLDYSHCTEEVLALLIYDLEEARFVNTLHVPMEEFDSLVRECEANRDLQVELEAAFPGCHVSADKLL